VSPERLVPSAARRLERAKEAGIKTSFLSNSDFIALRSVGIDPVAAVVGCRAQQIAWGELGLGEVGCGYLGWNARRLPWAVYSTGIAPGSSRPVVGSSSVTNSAGAPVGRPTVAIDGATRSFNSWPVQSASVIGNRPQPAAVATTQHGGNLDPRVRPVSYLHPLVHPIRVAISRMVLEASELGADGVIGVHIHQDKADRSRLASGDDKTIWELSVTGTAIRLPGDWRPQAPFATMLSGPDLLKLLAAGYVPVQVAVAHTLSLTHDLRRAKLERTKLSPVREVGFITDLVIHARRHAHKQIRKAVTESGGDGAILASQMKVELEEHSPKAGHDDVLATVTALASVVACYDEARAERHLPPPLSVLPLRNGPSNVEVHGSGEKPSTGRSASEGEH
jgi:hypothetical protein